MEIVGSWADISGRKQAETALGERMAVMNDLETLVGASPAIIYTTQVSGDYACTFVSENLDSIMAYSPWEMRDDKKFWVKRLHPDDANRVFAEMDGLIRQDGGSLNHFRHRDGHYIWIQDTFTVTHDDAGNPKEIVGSGPTCPTASRSRPNCSASPSRSSCATSSFARPSANISPTRWSPRCWKSPAGLEMGGREKRKVTMLMTDLRGFTSLSERLPAERVVALLNRYFTTMVTVIKQYQGTIDEFIGDAIFVLFGAPVWQEDDAERAVACAVAMQLAMASITNRTGRKTCPSSRWASGLIPVRWCWEISARPSG